MINDAQPAFDDIAASSTTPGTHETNGAEGTTKTHVTHPTTDAEWITSVMDRHADALVRYTARLTPDLDTARDVVQDAFLRLCKADRAVIGERVDLWLYTVCRNRAFDLHRKDRRMTPLTDAAVRTRPTADPGPEAAALNLDVHGRLLALLSTLSDRQQEVVRLKFQHELSYAEIAQVTGLSVANVGFILHQALKRLREMAARTPDPDAPASTAAAPPSTAAGASTPANLARANLAPANIAPANLAPANIAPAYAAPTALAITLATAWENATGSRGGWPSATSALS